MRRRCAGTWMRAAVSSSRLAVDGDDAAIGPQEPCDHVDQRGLAGARGAEQAGHAALAGEAGLKREFAELFDDVDAQHDQFPCRRWVARRASHFGGDQRRERNHDGDDHQPQRRGVAVRGLDQRIDRRGDGLGLAGNIRHEGNGRAEFADRLGKAEHHAGQHARQRQRQCDGQEHPERRGTQRLRRLFQPPVNRFDRQPDRAHQERKRHHAAGQRSSGPAKREYDAEMIGKPRADQAAASERQQQEIAGDDRRQHQRQVDQRVEHRLAPEIAPRQQPRHGDPERRRHQRRHRGDPQRKLDRRPFRWRDVEH